MGFHISISLTRCRDDPPKMAIKGSTTFSNDEALDDTSQADLTESQNTPVDESPCSATDVQNTSGKRKTDGKCGSKSKRSRRDVKEPSGAPEWQSRFIEMWERSMEEDNARFERSDQMLFREAQNKQMEQTNAILSGFKDIFKDLALK